MFHRLEGRHHLAGEEAHAFLGEVGREGAELEEAEEVADVESLAVFEEFLFHRGGAADDGVGAVFDLLAVFDLD